MQRTLFAVALISACTSSSGDSDDAHRQFIDKASRALHPAAAPLTANEIDAMMDLSNEEVVAKLYAAPETRDAVLALGLDFVGAPIDRLHQNGTWAAAPFVYAPAIASARAFRDGGDPLAPLFTTRTQPVNGVSTGPSEELMNLFFGEPLPGTPAQQRATIEGYFSDDARQLKQRITQLPEPFSQDAMCNLYQMSFTSIGYYYVPRMIGIPESIAMAGTPNELQYPEGFPLYDACIFQQPITRAEAISQIDAYRAGLTQLFTRLEPMFATWQGGSDAAFDPIDWSSIGFYPYSGQQTFARNTHFYPTFWDSAQNSSTNFSRRRGAYVLDRYFCDDLKPVGAALPASHGDGKHASDPGCMSCHFKLDPMAGFFRRHGFAGTEYTKATLQQAGNMITFDDGAQANFTTYEQAWRAPAGTGRNLNIGYIRSTSDDSLNSYGDTLADLDTILQTAPEVERCFVQRMFQHFNGVDQAVDPGFLDDVAADIHSKGPDRMKIALTRIIAGETFRATDRSSATCYDLAPNSSSKNSPPCEVASILKANCVSCHGGANPQAGLDLSVWEKDDDGKYGFHGQVSHTEILTRMLERVTTSDLARQMPQGREMNLHAREQLALWIQQQLGQ
ncbi:MAG TPA: c-type cytochrome domain-containing protein [Kofleriaceae bacterium]|nr:c-type cytochrome domain-containing protein [Kofleriaceae bacterium]